MSHQASGSTGIAPGQRQPIHVWDHSRICLIDEWNFGISDLGLFMQDQHITISCCILSSSIFLAHIE